MSTSFITFWQVSGLTSVYPFWGADSYWHKKIPANAPLAPNSAQMVNWLKSIPEHRSGHPTVNWNLWTEPLYDAYASTRKYSVYRDNHRDYLYNVPIPTGATPSSDADHLMGIVDWDSNYYYDFWNMRYESGQWKAGAGWRWDLTGSGVATQRQWTVGGSGTPLLATIIRPEEIAAGVIEHPISCCLKYPANYNIYPPASTHQDKPIVTAQYAIPYGARIQLDPNINLDSLGLNPTAKIIAKAMQDYGIVVKEAGGGWVLYAESDLSAHWANYGISWSTIMKSLFTIPAKWRIVDYSVFGGVKKY